jgi:hypothetical protein
MYIPSALTVPTKQIFTSPRILKAKGTGNLACLTQQAHLYAAAAAVTNTNKSRWVSASRALI